MQKCRRNFLTWITTTIAAIFGLSKAAQAATYHPGHNCPRCGNLVLVVFCNGPGLYHTHRCGTTTYWYH